MSQESKLLTTFGVIAVVVIGAGIFFASRDTELTTPPIHVNGEATYVRDYSFQSNKTAKATLVEFGDFQCPACKAASPVVEELLKKYPNDVNFVLRNFPLSIHQHATKAAYAYEAAKEQGEAMAMYKNLYDSQETWSVSSDPMPFFVSLAQSLNLNIDKFKADMASESVKTHVAQDTADGTELKVASTPTFFVNGQALPDYSLATMEKALGVGQAQ